AFGSIIFNLGSMLTWALVRSAAPESPEVRFLMGIGGAISVMYVGKRYITFVDNQIQVKASK
ncbi:hypothetical protein SK128_024852, partial [Halocaridina rubra]